MSRLLAYAQLVRLPNVFTALADISLGWLVALVVSSGPPAWPRFLLLLAASACLYTAGMVWNDFFDVEQDRKERPFRPLPSGRITRPAAGRLGAGLLAAGLVLAGLAGWRWDGGWQRAPAVVAGILAVVILLYDSWLKRTWLGPGAMGTCRFLNVLLGLSLVDTAALPWSFRVHLALVVGLYIAGVTWFARTEAQVSNQAALAAAAGLMLIALLFALAVPARFPPATSSPLFPYLLVGFGFLVGIPAVRAIAQPTPSRVQSAVKSAVLGLVILDAVLATALVGVAGLVIVVLLFPALYLGRWVYST
jgi:4-hydroxybenzoate polyprenyltransferase